MSDLEGEGDALRAEAGSLRDLKAQLEELRCKVREWQDGGGDDAAEPEVPSDAYVADPAGMPNHVLALNLVRLLDELSQFDRQAQDLVWEAAVRLSAPDEPRRKKRRRRR